MFQHQQSKSCQAARTVQQLKATAVARQAANLPAPFLNSLDVAFGRRDASFEVWVNGALLYHSQVIAR